MRLHEIELIESRGFAARRTGEEFINPKNPKDLAVFKELITLPADEPEYPTHNDFIKAYDKWAKTAPGEVYTINVPQSRTKSAMIVNLDTPRGSEYFVLFMTNVSNLTGKLTEIAPNIIKPGHGGYILNRAVSRKERAGVKPADVLKSAVPLTSKQVAPLLDSARATAGDEIVDQMQGYLNALASGRGTGYVIKGGAAHETLYTNYLGEWASPIALITGQFEPKDQITQIEDAMLGGNSLRSGKIIYNTNERESLFDSKVLVGGDEIFISTKESKKGAAASLDGLYKNVIQKPGALPPNFWRSPKAKRFRDVVTTIIQGSQITGILRLAESEGIISRAEGARIENGIASREVKSPTPFKPTSKLEEYMSDYGANMNNPHYDPAKHALASVARKVADKLNAEDYTDIYKKILNYASIVQMYFNGTVKGADLVCNSMKLVWPPQFEGKIYFFASKNYSATEIKGKLGFLIDPKGRIINDPDPSLRVSIDDKTKAKLAKERQKAKDLAVGKITKKGERDVRAKGVSDVVALGRKKK